LKNEGISELCDPFRIADYFLAERLGQNENVIEIHVL